tara:strand:- start:3688 stop:4899 length:1212 start_codon:yes stop_codon:yes gene_type:complete
MKKLSFSLLLFSAACLSMIYFVANLAEKEIKAALSDIQNADFSTQLLSYERGFFSATAITEAQINTDQDAPLTFKIITTIHHYPYQAVLNNHIELTDTTMAQKAASYFGRADWITSVETINLLSQLTGQLTVIAGKYESESESMQSKPLVLDYQVDLKNKKADLVLNWAGLVGTTYGTSLRLNGLTLTSHIASLSIQDDYDYQIAIETLEVQQENTQSLIEGIQLTGNSQQGQKVDTLDTLNDLSINSYQIKNETIQTFTKNRLKLALTGLYQPAFELINTGSDDPQIIQQALNELVNHGAQLSLSTLSSQTPWGEIDGELDLVLDKGASLMDIIINPYILFDYISGDARLMLPVTLLDEPLLAESLQMGVMTGFLEVNEETLNLQTSFQKGELTVNGRIVPL